MKKYIYIFVESNGLSWFCYILYIFGKIETSSNYSYLFENLKYKFKYK